MAMDFTEVSILHHVAIVFVVLWLLTSYGYCNMMAYFLAFAYLCLVYERHILRLRRRLQHEERKNSNQRKLLSDSESVRWLNHAVEKVWPICMEQIASQKFLLPIIPWFLDKYKPWTAKKAVVQHLYLGKSPPMFTEIRVLPQSADDDHLVLELGMNFLSGDDMSAILAVKLRKRLGFGLWAKMHVTGMHIEGKVLVGVKFLHQWPFLERLRISFVEPPYFQMTVKPIFTHGVDVTELPGIAGWLDKLLSIAFQQTLVEPNLLVVDVKKFVSDPKENWFTMDEKRPIAYAKVEVIEGADMKPSDMNGLADPYVKGRLGPYRFRTKIQWKTLTPKWSEEFKIPITSWEIPNELVLEVRDKDHIFDDTLGDCRLDVGEMRGGSRYEKWLPLQNIKMGRLHLAVTIIDADNDKVDSQDMHSDMNLTGKEHNRSGKDDCNVESVNGSKITDSKASDEFEPINIEGQEKTGIWVHHPGNESSQAWERRKGKIRLADTELHCETGSPGSIPGSQRSDSNSSEESKDGQKGQRLAKIKKGFRKIGSVLQRSPKTDTPTENTVLPTPPPNIHAIDQNNVGINFILDETKTGGDHGNVDVTEAGTEGDGGKHHARTMAKGFLKQAGSLKGVLTRNSFRKSKTEKHQDQILQENDDSSSEEGSSTRSPMIVEGIEISAKYTMQQAVNNEKQKTPVSAGSNVNSGSL